MKARITSVEYTQNGLGLPAGAGAPAEYTSDLAVQVALKLFSNSTTDPVDVDYLILCTQTPDFLLPTTACLVQSQIGLRASVGAIDVAGGRPGFVYALALAQGLIFSDQARCVMVISADTGETTRSAAATFVVADSDREGLDAFAFGFAEDPEFSAEIVLAASGLDWVYPDLLIVERPTAEQMDNCSSTLPIALADAIDQGRVHRGDKLVLLGSDVRGSWAGAMVTW